MATHSPRTPAEAVALLRSAVACVAAEQAAAPLDHRRTWGRVLAEEIRSDRPSPPADVSAMDGYALRLADLHAAAAAGAEGRAVMPVADDAAIGRPAPALRGGSCARIVTGALVPAGADTIIRREDVQELESHPDAVAAVHGDDVPTIAPQAGAAGRPLPRAISVDAPVIDRLRKGESIRRAGENAPTGAMIAPPGRVLDAAIVGAIAAFGRDRVLLRRPLRVAVVTTGDEVVPIGAPAQPWQIRESNGAAILSLLARLPWIADVERVHVGDELDLISTAVRRALDSADALLLTGGVSMGHRDFGPEALGRNGVRTLFHRLPQRPGRPLLAGVTTDGRPVLGLPGNPISVLVTLRRFALPALAQRAGAAPSDPVASVSIRNDDGRRIDLWWHRLVRLVDDGVAELVDSRGSGDLVSAAASDGFVEIPPGAGGAGPWPFRSWTP